VRLRSFQDVDSTKISTACLWGYRRGVARLLILASVAKKIRAAVFASGTTARERREVLISHESVLWHRGLKKVVEYLLTAYFTKLSRPSIA
jgi:hypothetical protein